MALDRLTKITGPGVATDTNWVGNNADFTGITTTATSFNIGVTTIHSNLIEAHNIKSTGIITATGGSFSGNVTAVDGTFSGNVSIAGTLTYEDVTNIDSVGIITAPALDVDDFLDVGSNIKLGNAGVITATSFVGSGAALTGIDATAVKDSGGNVKIQAQASGAVYTGIHTFGTNTNFTDIDVDGHTNLDNVSIAGVVTATRFVGETNGLVNVKTYGAVGDGTTDDRAAIQSAINSAKTVFFPAGTYRVGAALTVWDSYSALIGHESLPTIKVVGTGYSGPAVSVQSAGDNINEFSRIENIKFLFDKNSGGPATYSSTPNETNCGVSINGSLAPTASATNRVLRFKMENCRVLGFSNAINLKETTNTLLRRVIIEHNTDESSTTLSSSNIYCGVNFDGTPGQVGGISPQASVELHQVIFNGSGAPTNTTSMGFRVTGQDPRDIFFEGCETAHGNYGWFIDPSDDDYNIDIHINRPIVDAVDTTGIYVKDWNGYGALTINGGYVVKDANNSGSGIWVENSRGVNITGGIQVLGVSLNNVANDDGIRIKNSKICSVSSSTIMNCRYGISLEDSSNCSVTGNIVGAEIGAFTGGTNPVLSDAIRLFGNSDTNTISGNTIKGASSTYKYSNGILINASTCEENMVSSNVIDDSTVTIRLNDAGVRTNIFDRGKIGISTTSGGKLLVGGGTGSAIEFNDSNTKLEIPAANTLAAYTSGNERLRIASNGQVSISSDGTTDGLLTIKGNSDQVGTPSIRLLDGSDTREVSISNHSGDFVASVHGNDNAIHGHIKMFESGQIDFNNGGASGSNTNRLRITSDGNIGFNRSNTTVGDSQSGNSTATPKRIVFNNDYSNGYTDSSLKLYLYNENATRQGFTSGPLYDLQYHSSGHATHAKHAFFTQNVERLRITGDGNLAMGNTNAVKKVHISSTGNQKILIDPNYNNNSGGSANSEANANNIVESILIRTSYGDNAASSANAGHKWGIKFQGYNGNDFTQTSAKTAAVYAVSEDTGAGYNRQVGLAFHTSPYDTAHREVMRINKNGIVTKPYQYVFTVETTGTSKSANWSKITGLTIRASQSTGVSDGTYWSNSTQRFTAPVAGIYHFFVGGWANSSSNGSRYAYTFKHQNGNHYDFIGGGNYCLVDSPMDGFSRTIKLSAGEWVELWGYSSVSATWGGGHRFFWGGYLLG